VVGYHNPCSLFTGLHQPNDFHQRSCLIGINRENVIFQVEDIVDSGRTGVHLREYFSIRGASSVRMVSLLSKPSRREVEFEPDYLGFTIEDEFVVGYGLDIDQELRSLPYIGILATV